MELFLNLDDEDFHSSSKKPHSNPDAKYTPKLCPPEWFMTVKNPPKEVRIVAETKYAADYAYMKRNYREAINLYTQVVEESSKHKSGNAFVREAIESLIRSYLKTDNLDEALSKSEFLLTLTKRINLDHTIICLDLLANAYNRKERPLSEIECLTSIIQLNHSLLPDLWIRLGKAYKCLDARQNGKETDVISTDAFPQFSKQPDCVIYCCFIRALVLLKTVEGTVISFASSANTSAQEHLKDEILKIGHKSSISEGKLDYLKREMSKDIFNRYGTNSSLQNHNEADFVDLGSSKHRKEFQDREGATQVSNLCQISNVAEFENKWFGFLAIE